MRNVKTNLHNIPPFFWICKESFLVVLAPFFACQLADLDLEAGLLNLYSFSLKIPLSSLAFNKEEYNVLNTVKIYTSSESHVRRSTYTSVQKFMHIFFQTEFASLLHSSCYIIM
jgi:hypothetical protein